MAGAVLKCGSPDSISIRLQAMAITSSRGYAEESGVCLVVFAGESCASSRVEVAVAE